MLETSVIGRDKSYLSWPPVPAWSDSDETTYSGMNRFIENITFTKPGGPRLKVLTIGSDNR